MTLSHIPIDKITESDLQSLIDNQICESKYIDYKRCIPTNTENNNSKTEFLSDVASFANAQGGELLYGIKESNGLPEEIIGCETDNPEKEILRLEGIIRSGIEKPIMGIEIRPIPLENGKYCFVIRIPNSQFKPHFVKHNSLFRVVSRNSSGKNDLGVDEIGELFLRSQNRKEAIRNFRLKRVSEILAGETPVPVDEGPKLVIHLIPTIEQNIDLKKLHHHKLIVPPNHTQGCCVNDQINLDGLVRHHKTRDSSPSYVQIYAERAMIESVFDMNYSIKKDNTSLCGIQLETIIIESILNFLSGLKDLSISPPFVMILSLLQVKDWILDSPSWPPRNSSRTNCFEKENILVPERLIEGFLEGDMNEINEYLKPPLDLIWNAAGVSESPHKHQ